MDSWFGIGYSFYSMLAPYDLYVRDKAGKSATMEKVAQVFLRHDDIG
jgi:hypothetical protein